VFTNSLGYYNACLVFLVSMSHYNA